MKVIFFSLIFIPNLFILNIVLGQKPIQTSEHFSISGLVKKEITVNLDDIKKLPTKEISNFVITNHLGEVKKEYKKLKVVSLKTILEKAEIDVPSPKELSECYLVFTATDNYKNVYSWNEIFNSEIGNNLFLVTQHEDFTIENMPERLLVISTTDFKTGRRHLKGLTKIEIFRIK